MPPGADRAPTGPHRLQEDATHMATDIWTRARATAAVVVLVALACACGSSSGPALPPGEAADTLARNLGLDDEQTSCMRSQFERAPGAAAVLDPEAAASDAERDRFLAAIRACLPPEDLGATLAATVRDDLPEATDAQADCVRTNVIALSTAEQDRLYLYFANPATLDVADVGPAGAELLASCDLGTATTGGDAPGTDPASPATTGPASGG